METRVRQDPKAHRVRRETPVRLALKDLKDLKDLKERKGIKEILELQALRGLRVILGRTE